MNSVCILLIYYMHCTITKLVFIRLRVLVIYLRMVCEKALLSSINLDTSLQAYIRFLTAAAPSDNVFRALGTN